MTIQTSAEATDELNPFVRWSKHRPDTKSDPDPDRAPTGSLDPSPKVIPLPRTTDSKTPRFWQTSENFNSIKNWEGVVLTVGEDSFFARVRDPDKKSDLGEITFEIPIEDVTEDDNTLLTEGAVFYLTIGYRQIPGQPIRKDATLIFRRMPAWSKKRLTSAKELEDELTTILKPQQF